MHLDKQHPRPVYLQLKEMLLNQIEQGFYLSHQQLPSERDLCQHHNLSRMTARRALQELIAEGFAYTRAGKGTFVSGQSSLETTRSVVGARFGRVSRLKAIANKTEYGLELIHPLESLDCVGSERAIREALSTHSLETVACRIFPKIIESFERRWHKGEISLLVHNYAITTLHSHLVGMVNASTMVDSGPKVLLACAPEDHHDIGLLLLALILRRRGVLVIYLGTNLAFDDLEQALESTKPQVVCISAATEQSAHRLKDLGQEYQRHFTLNTAKMGPASGQKPIFSFGGIVFGHNQDLVDTVPGLYLGDTIAEAAARIQGLFEKQEPAVA